MSDIAAYLISSARTFQYMPLSATSEQISEYTLVWVSSMIWIIVIVIAALIYIVSTRRLRPGAEGFQEKVLLDELDLGDDGSPKLRDLLIEKEPVFFQKQLDIFNSTRKIYEQIIKTVAGVLAADEQAGGDYRAYVDAAIQSIAEKAGETPRFCGTARLDAILDAPIRTGAQPSLDDLHTCLPAAPGKYLLLLSYASRILKEQLDSSRTVLGNAVPHTEIDLEEPPMVAGSASVAKKRTSQAASDAAYISRYALTAPVRGRGVAEGFSGSATATASAPATSFDNQLAAWKQAYDAEALKRIEMYIRYCNNVFKTIDTVRKDAESGAIFKKMDLGPATESAKSLMNIPL
jgi:hypothetical protein